jgi:hypothetical protein
VRRAIVNSIVVALIALAPAGGAAPLFASARSARVVRVESAPVAMPQTRNVDGVAARIEDDVITESEIRELGAFEQLVDGKAKSRAELIRLLADQWLVRTEAVTGRFAQPTAPDVDRAVADFAKQFPSQEEFQQRCAAAGLTPAAIRRLIAQQLYLSKFIDYRFRPAAQVTDQQVEDYYNKEFAPQLKSRNQEVPPLDDVDETIREILILRAIQARADKWLADTRDRVKLDIVSKQDALPAASSPTAADAAPVTPATPATSAPPSPQRSPQ